MNTTTIESNEELKSLDQEFWELQRLTSPENYVPAISGTELMAQDFSPRTT